MLLKPETGQGNNDATYNGLMPCTTVVGVGIISGYHSLRGRGGGMELDNSHVGHVLVTAPCSYIRNRKIQPHSQFKSVMF